MATNKISKLSRWFSTKSLRIGLHRRRSRSTNSSSSSSISMCTPISPKNKTSEGELKDVFRYFDGNGDGKISAYELRSYFGSIGEHMTREEAEGVIHELDSDGDNLLDFEDFMKLMMNKSEKGGGGDDDEDLRKAFEMFVWEKEGYDGNCITPKGLQRMLHRLGDDKSYDECVAMIDAFDVDHNGVLDFNEFHQMMMP